MIQESYMGINEFKNRISLIISFTERMNEETIPYDIKKIMAKIYANTLSINLTDRMVDNIFETTDSCA
ncbi:MAG: hypothetical protein ACM3TR_05970 [Caulobacteraceae bacterium]